MALYLGNQKVSLRSGQDPTFDYGFDSNGRLVFANKNATEINNFLNYDSSYSEILDLSNLSKMEKVAVNGTADRKMEGLKGLLVSQNAPFTGTSPQINVSYTGLNKSALVSLFESVPYNVGYTKVGSPTIVNGVVSRLSSSDYLNVYNFEQYKPFEFVLKIYTGTRQSDTCYLIRSNGLLLYWMWNYKLGFFLRNTDNKQIEIDGVTKLLANTNYWVKMQYDGQTMYLYLSTDGINYNLENSRTINVITTSYHTRIGEQKSSGAIFNGSIDLNETYIKVNGVYWFTGKPAMKKTCSIVGATGTADLTQEDKNIILNKGWRLTVQ